MTYVTPADAILPGHVDRFEDLVTYLEAPPTRGAEIYRNDGTTEDGRAIVDCSHPGRLGLAVDFTDESSLGRFAFKVVVRNPLDSPVPNIWTLRSNSDGELIEEGASGGYDVSNYTALTEPRSGLSPVSSMAQCLVRIHWLTALLISFLNIPVRSVFA